MVKHLKDEIRKEILAKRDSISSEDADFYSQKIAETLFGLHEYKKAHTVAFYLPIRNEVNTRKMVLHALKNEKEVLVPVTNSKIKFYQFQSFDDLKPGKFSVPEPTTKKEPSKQPDLIIVPGVAFGFCMHRIGYGKGYYDDFLATSQAYRVGVCFDFQLVKKLPIHDGDQKMDCILTENRIIYPSKDLAD